MTCLLLVSVFAAFQFEDAFDYPNGSEGGPAWFAESVAWEVQDGTMVHVGHGVRSALILEQAPFGHSVTIEAEVTPREAEGEEWAIAGVGVRWDEDNYWRLALVEAPARLERRHFTEMNENLSGVWLAQGREGSKLECTAYEGGDFVWQYGVTYTLRLALSPEGIEGVILEGGQQRAHFAYRFSGPPAVTKGQPTLDCAGIGASFDGVRVTVADEVAAPEPEQGAWPECDVPAFEEIEGEATGFFHTQEIDGVWWLIEPKGRAFYAVGTDHVRYGGHHCQSLGYAPYGKVTEAKYGSEEDWAEATTERLATWGFNIMTAGHSPSMRHRRFAHTEFLSMGSTFSGIDDICPKTYWTGFPNVFSPKWPRHCDKLARRVCALAKDDPWLVGYFIDNELEWYGKTYRDEGLFEEAWKKPEGHTAKQAWVNFLKERAGNVAVFKEMFGVEVENFEALAGHTEPQPPRSEQARALCREWVRLVAERYFSVTTEAIRRYDPNHLVLGSRFAGRAPDIWDIAGTYCDVVSFNMYPRIDVKRGVPEGVVDTIRKWAGEAKRPLMITEWSFPALDSGLPCTHGAGMRVDTQQQRTQCFNHFQAMMFGLPFMVGSDFFMFVDEPKEGISEHFPEDSNYGLVNGEDEPYAEMTSTAEALNKKVYAIHASGSGTEPAQKAQPVAWMRELPAASSETVPEGLRIEMGALAVESIPGGWRVSHGGTVLGEWVAMMHQHFGRDLWIRADNTRMLKRYEGEQATVLDVEFRYGDANANAPEKTPGTPRGFASQWRFWFPKQGEWFASQCLWVENADTVAWELVDVFHNVRPSLGGSNENDEGLVAGVPNYYARGSVWVDETLGLGLACWYANDDDFQSRFWKDESGFHGDLRRVAQVMLGPGERYEEASPHAFFFAVEKPFRESFGRLSNTIEQQAVLP